MRTTYLVLSAKSFREFSPKQTKRRSNTSNYDLHFDRFYSSGIEWIRLFRVKYRILDLRVLGNNILRFSYSIYPDYQVDEVLNSLLDFQLIVFVKLGGIQGQKDLRVNAYQQDFVSRKVWWKLLSIVEPSLERQLNVSILQRCRYWKNYKFLYRERLLLYSN